MTRVSCAAPRLCGTAVALGVIGVSLLGWVFAASSKSKVYQARQERAFFLVSSETTPDPATPRGGDPLVLGRIEIPRIGIDAMVREGVDDASLAIAVGHIPGTARPGERGNMALAGHRDSFFRALRDIRHEDVIKIVTQEGSYEYVVYSTEVVSPEDIWVLDPTSDTILSLVTCYPFTYVGHAPNRFIVRASLIASPRKGPAEVAWGERAAIPVMASAFEDTEP